MSVTDKIRLWNSLCAFLPLLLYDSWTKRRRHLEIRHFMSIVRDSNLLSSLSGNNSAKTSVVLKDRDPLQLCTTHMSLTFFWLISFSKPARLIKVQQLLKSIWEIFEAVVGVARRQGGVRLAAVRMCRFLKLDSCVLLIPASAVRCSSVTSSAGFTAPSYQALSTFTPTLVYITSFIQVFACIHYQYFGLLCHYYGWIKNSSLYTDLSLIYTFHCVHCFMPTESYTSPCWTDRVLVTQCTYICRELQTAYLQRASAAKRRQCPKYVVEPVCGLLFLVLLLVSESHREQLNHIMQRTEGKLSVKDNVKCALQPLQLHFILHSLSLMPLAFLLMLSFFSVQVGLSTSQRLLSARSRYALLALCG